MNIFELAKQAGFHKWYTQPEEHPDHVAIVARFAALVRAAALEEAAGVADEHAGDCYMGDIDWHEAKRIAAAELRRLHEANEAKDALLRQALSALEEERRIRLIGQSPECGQVHWESMRDMRRAAYASTDATITAIRARLEGKA
jgi:hypothetical protein